MPLVDLSVPIRSSPPETPDLLRTEIAFHDHAEGARGIEALFGVPARLLRDGEGWAVEEFLRFGTHNSTHVDAPYHYNSTIQGEPAQTIDQLPLDLFYRPGVVLDFTHKEDGDPVTAAEIDATGIPIEAGTIVLVHTGRDAFLDAPDYMARGCGVTAEATHHLFDRGVRVMGIDAWGWDAPLHLQARRALDEDAEGVFWEAHQANLPYCQIERLTGLAALPSTGFMVACFPLPIVGASGAPARVVAIVPDP